MIEFFASHMPGPKHWLLLSMIIFAIGLYGTLSRRNAIGVLMAIELMLNAAALNVVIFNRFVAPGTVDGQIMAIFVIAVAAAEAVVAMAIFVVMFSYRSTIDVNRMDMMRN